MSSAPLPQKCVCVLYFVHAGNFSYEHPFYPAVLRWMLGRIFSNQVEVVCNHVIIIMFQLRSHCILAQTKSGVTHTTEKSDFIKLEGVISYLHLHSYLTYVIFCFEKTRASWKSSRSHLIAKWHQKTPKGRSWSSPLCSDCFTGQAVTVPILPN